MLDAGCALSGRVSVVGLNPGGCAQSRLPWLPSAAPPVLVESILIGPAALPYLKKVYNVCAIQEMQIYEIKDLSADVR